MRVGKVGVETVKEKVKELQGKSIEMVINKGRNKYVTLNAIIESVYPSMFIIKPLQKTSLDRFSYSYSDILCGEVVLSKINLIQDEEIG